MSAPNGLVLLTNQYQPNPELEGDISITNIFADRFRETGGSVYLDARGDVSAINGNILTTAPGEVGDIVINAGGTVRLEGTTVSSNLASGAVGAGGNIRIRARNVDMRNVARLDSSTRGIGNAGNVEIEARDRVVFDGFNVDGQRFSLASSAVEAGASGAGGDVLIRSGSLEVINGAILDASTFSIGNAGNVVIEARDQVLFAGLNVDSQSSSGAFSTVEAGVVGNGGDVVIRTGALTVSNQAILDASTFGIGNAGNVVIEARDRVVLDDSAAFVRAELGATGAGGNMLIRTGTLTLTNGSALTATTLGTGDAGDVVIEAPLVSLNQNSSIQAVTRSLGKGGNVTIQNIGGPLVIQGAGRLTVETMGGTSGRAGILTIMAADLALRDGVELSASTESINGGGNIAIDVVGLSGNLTLSGNSLINAQSTNPNPNAQGGGNIDIRVSDGFVIGLPGENNDIIANAVGGNGGNINIMALRILEFVEQVDTDFDRLRANRTNDISASSEFGFDGVITLDTLDLDPSQGLVELPAELSDRANQITAGCGLGNTDGLGEFIVTGSGGLPPNPSDPLTPTGMSIPWVTDDSTAPVAKVSTIPVPPQLVEAQRLVLDANGQPYLVAEVAPVSASQTTTAANLCQLVTAQ